MKLPYFMQSRLILRSGIGGEIISRRFGPLILESSEFNSAFFAFISSFDFPSFYFGVINKIP